MFDVKSREIVREFKRDNPLLEIASKYLPVVRRSGRYVTLCPFHEENTPSFYVNVEDEYWHCFGCGRSGDVIDLVKHFEGKTFTEVISEKGRFIPSTVKKHQEMALAEKKSFREEENIPPPFGVDVVDRLHKSLLENAECKRVRSYAFSRFSEDAIRTFKLGCVDSEILKEFPDFFTNIFKAKDRLLFPILDVDQKLVGFSGRDVTGLSKTKYLFPTGFKKNLFFFGEHLFNSVENISKGVLKYQLLFVEGPADVLACYEYGFPAVATLGTSFSLVKLHNFCYDDRFFPLSGGSVNCHACFDGDVAGLKAEARVRQKKILNMGFIQIPVGTDPYSFLKNHPEAEECFWRGMTGATKEDWIYRQSLKGLGSEKLLRYFRQAHTYFEEAKEKVTGDKLMQFIRAKVNCCDDLDKAQL